MTTKPGYVWDDANDEWVNIGQAAVVAPVYYQATAPTSPATGDIWIDSDDDVPSIDSSVFYRWKKTAIGGETTLSGADDAGLLLKYTVGYEELYINGVLQVRGSDYVATTGTTITGLTALVAGDIVTVMSQVAYSLADTYTQNSANEKFYSKTPSASSGEASTVNINTKPWNMPWGIISYAKSSSNTITSAKIPGLARTITAVTGRLYRISVTLNVALASSAGRMLSAVTVGGTVAGRVFDMTNYGGDWNYVTSTGVITTTMTSGSRLIEVGFANISGANTLGGGVGNEHFIIIEDIGPA